MAEKLAKQQRLWHQNQLPKLRRAKQQRLWLTIKQKTLDNHLTKKHHTIYFGSHPSNIVPMQGKLPKHKQAMLEAVREKREQLRRHLDEYPQRGGEGSILNR